MGLIIGQEAKGETNGEGQAGNHHLWATDERLRWSVLEMRASLANHQTIDAPPPTLPRPSTPAPEALSTLPGEANGGSVPSDIACAYPWPQGCAWALFVIDCESDFDAGADENLPYVGWWQIDVNHLNPGAALDGFGWTVADLYDPEINTAAAWELYQLQGPGAWPGCGK